MALPLYFKKLTIEEYGLIAIAQMVQTFLIPVLSFGSSETVMRFYYEWKDEDRSQRLTTSFVSSFCIGLVSCLILIGLGNLFWPSLIENLPFEPFVTLTIWTSLVNTVINFCSTTFRVREEVKNYTLLTMGLYSFQVVFIFYFLFALEAGAVGFLQAILLNSALWAVIGLWLIRGNLKLPIRATYLREQYAYSLPLIPSTILTGIAHSADRFILEKILPLGQLGLYNLAHQFGNGLNLFNQFLKTAYLPFTFKVLAEREDQKAIMSATARLYIAAFCVPALAIACFNKDLLTILHSPQYDGVTDYIPLSIIFYFGFGLVTAFGRGIDISKKTNYTVLIELLWVTGLFVFLPFFTRQFGLTGAFIGVIAAAYLRALMQIFVSYLLNPLPIKLLPLFGTLILAVVFFFISEWIGHFGTALGIGARGLLIAVFVLLIAQMNVPNLKKFLSRALKSNFG